MTKGVVLLVGTRKGAYLFRASTGRSRWKAEGPLFAGEPVHHMTFDPRDGVSIFAACNLTWGGPKIRVSRDLGRTWSMASNPAFPEGSALTFARTWHIEPGPASRPNEMWAGVEPAALFRSDDRGMSWRPVTSLNEHSTRDRWSSGAGGLILHSIAMDATDPSRLAVAISAAGMFESADRGATWRPRNEGVRADFMPGSPLPEVGQCVHHLVAHPASSGVRFQQNHCGVYWLTKGASRWTDVSAGLPSEFGFAAAIHPRDDAMAWVLPLEPSMRLTPEPGPAVYLTRDRGSTWKRQARGLERGARLEALREGMATDTLDPAGVYFGTTNGELWASADEGRGWSLVTRHLPGILSVSTATLSA